MGECARLYAPLPSGPELLAPLLHYTQHCVGVAKESTDSTPCPLQGQLVESVGALHALLTQLTTQGVAKRVPLSRVEEVDRASTRSVSISPRCLFLFISKGEDGQDADAGVCG
jgi:hypothetical protein